MKRYLLLFLTIILLITSCQKREWSNPFDPECPKVTWTPTDFAAKQQENTIILTWVQKVNNISEFRIERKIEGEAAWTEIVSLEKTISTWADPGITGGKLYEYRIVAVAGSNESNFATAQIKPLLTATPTTAVPSAITAASAIVGGSITLDGGAPVTERGVCWATTTGPTISTTKLAIGNGIGSFSNTITGLTANTIYYLRAYAINSQGTAYGNEVNFKTSFVLSLATLTTNAATNMTSNSVTLGGNITSDGNATVTERGICYSTSAGPTTSSPKVVIGSGSGSFSNSIPMLTANTIYYVRAYAINSQGTAYGNEVNFKTSVVLSLATLTTNTATNITSTSATLGGNISNDGNATITERGVCYSTSANPTTSNTKLAIGAGTGTFSNSITSLTANTIYYLKAYATNSQGTAYGNEVSFKTDVAPTLATLTTNVPADITSTSATLGGNISSDGNANVTERGVCYSTSTNPTTSNTKLTIGNGTGSFSNTITGLTANTTYYVRAYAINNQGTAYGNEVSFTCLQGFLPDLTTNASTSISSTSAILGGNVIFDGNDTIIERGICYNTSPNPTINNSKIEIGSGTGIFSNTVTELVSNTTYYVRSYAINRMGISYGNQIVFLTNFGEVTDIDGNNYQAIKIGTQVWMAENLKTTKYNDGTPIPNVTDNNTWAGLTSGAYCWYNNDEGSFKNAYGALFNWYAVNTGNLAPAGWHVPTNSDWDILTIYLGGEDVAGGKLKELGITHWKTPNGAATNTSKFTGLPGGGRISSNGLFGTIGIYGNWWSSTLNSNLGVFSRSLYYNYGYVRKEYSFYLNLGFSVRCIKD